MIRTMSQYASKEDYWRQRASDAEGKLDEAVAALVQIELSSTDQHAVGIAKAALAKVEE